VTKREFAAAPGARWSAHAPIVLTRPSGAAFDLLTKPLDHGGLNPGTAGSSLVLAAILVVLVVWTSFRHGRIAQT
jgi:uncharacterized membrane-anchored protein